MKCPDWKWYVYGKGFTLVELMVTLAIIMIMVVILVPAVSRGMDRARRLNCLGNLRQIAQGASMYITDQLRYLPERELGCGHWGNAASHLMPYVGEDVRIFRCPANKHRITDKHTEMLPDYPGNYTEYEFNGYICSCSGYQRLKNWIDNDADVAYCYDYPYDPSAEYRAHKGGVNCAYLDGHAAWLADEDMGPLNPDNEETFYKKGHRCW